MIPVLFLDDDLQRHAVVRSFFIRRGDFRVVGVHTADAAIRALKERHYFLVLLDHDLESLTGVNTHGTGQTVAEYIALHLPRNRVPFWVHIHSWNAKGAHRMAHVLKPHVRHVTKAPFTPTARYWNTVANQAVAWWEQREAR